MTSSPGCKGATIRQTDFAITPYSGFFGALKLRDEVNVEFEVAPVGSSGPEGAGDMQHDHMQMDHMQ